MGEREYRGTKDARRSDNAGRWCRMDGAGRMTETKPETRNCTWTNASGWEQGWKTGMHCTSEAFCSFTFIELILETWVARFRLMIAFGPTDAGDGAGGGQTISKATFLLGTDENWVWRCSKLGRRDEVMVCTVARDAKSCPLQNGVRNGRTACCLGAVGASCT
jgi:hypothetical protein